MLVAALIWLRVPDAHSDGKGAGFKEQLAGIREVFASRHFWRYARMGFWMTGGFMAVQGLWASRWMNVLEGMDRAAIASRLTWISGAMLAGFLFMGFFATRLVHRGIKLEKVYLGAMVVALGSFGLICLAPGLAGNLPVAGARHLLLRCPTSRIRSSPKHSRPHCPGAPTRH